MKIKATVEDIIEFAEWFLQQIKENKENNGVVSAGNDSKRTLINFSHVKYIMIEAEGVEG